MNTNIHTYTHTAIDCNSSCTHAYVRTHGNRKIHKSINNRLVTKRISTELTISLQKCINRVNIKVNRILAAYFLIQNQTYHYDYICYEHTYKQTFSASNVK